MRHQAPLESSKARKELCSRVSTEPGMLPKSYDQSLLTRNACIAGTALAWLVAFGAFIASIISFACQYPLRINQTGLDNNYSWSRIFPEPGEILLSHSSTFALAGPLCIIALITGLNECLGYVHTTGLRWNLWKEGRLEWNTNLRLLSNTHNSISNRWYMNIIYYLCITFSYSAASQIILDPVFTMDWCIHNPDCSVEVLLFNGVAGCALALGLFGQAIFATWILIAHRKQILTWSSNPLNNAMAIATNDRSNGKTTPTGFRSRRTSAGKLCDTTTGHKSNKIKAQEGLKRPGIAPSYGFSKVIVIILWVSLFVTLVWTVGIILGVHAQTFDYCKHELERVGGPCVKEPRFMKVPSILMDERENPYDTFREASTEFEGLSFSVLGADYSHPSALYHTMTFLFTTAMQSYLTFALHCAELLINLRRDEKTWRQASSRRGTTSTTNSVSAAFASWETIGLFAFKTVIHWLFGRCVISEAESKFKGGPLEFRMMTNVRMGLGAFALVYLSAVTLSLAGFCTALAYYKPKGLQPSTHGHYQSLIELMGQCRMFQKRIFWDEGMSQADEYTRCSSDGSVEQDKQPATGAKRPARTDTGGSFLRSNMAPAVLAGTSNM